MSCGSAKSPARLGERHAAGVGTQQDCKHTGGCGDLPVRNCCVHASLLAALRLLWTRAPGSVLAAAPGCGGGGGTRHVGRCRSICLQKQSRQQKGTGHPWRTWMRQVTTSRSSTTSSSSCTRCHYKAKYDSDKMTGRRCAEVTTCRGARAGGHAGGFSANGSLKPGVLAYQ